MSVIFPGGQGALPPPLDAGEGVLPPLDPGEVPPLLPLVTAHMHALLVVHDEVDDPPVLKFNLDLPYMKHPGGALAEDIIDTEVSESPNIFAAASHSSDVV